MLPQVISTFSHGTPSDLSGDAVDVDHRLGAEVADARLHVERPSGLITSRPSKPFEPAKKVLIADADAAHLRAGALAALRLALRPS